MHCILLKLSSLLTNPPKITFFDTKPNIILVIIGIATRYNIYIYIYSQPPKPTLYNEDNMDKKKIWCLYITSFIATPFCLILSRKNWYISESFFYYYYFLLFVFLKILRNQFCEMFLKIMAFKCFALKTLPKCISLKWVEFKINVIKCSLLTKD